MHCKAQSGCARTQLLMCVAVLLRAATVLLGESGSLCFNHLNSSCGAMCCLWQAHRVDMG
jgi:hypothetical protein